MGLKGKRNKVEVLRFEPCFSASLFCCRFPVGSAPGPVPLGHNQNGHLAAHSLPPSFSLPDSFPGTAGRGAGGHPGGLLTLQY